jgi:hypothetical protein
MISGSGRPNAAIEGRPDMNEIRMLRSTIADTRRYGALSLFRLANCVLRSAIGLNQRRMISRTCVQVALSVAGMLEKAAAALLFGPKRSQPHDDSKLE